MKEPVACQILARRFLSGGTLISLFPCRSPLLCLNSVPDNGTVSDQVNEVGPEIKRCSEKQEDMLSEAEISMVVTWHGDVKGACRFVV